MNINEYSSEPRSFAEYVANRVIEYLKERDKDIEHLSDIGVNRCGLCNKYYNDYDISVMCTGCHKNLCRDCMFYFDDKCLRTGCAQSPWCIKCIDGCEHGRCGKCKMKCIECTNLEDSSDNE
jgi:hypothetical protein